MTKESRRRKYAVVDAIIGYGESIGKEISCMEAINMVEYIHRSETTLSRLAEDECNYPVYDEAKQERTEQRIEKYVRENIGCPVHTQRDPRGYCIRLHIKCKENHNFFNTWDGETTAMDW